MEGFLFWEEGVLAVLGSHFDTLGSGSSQFLECLRINL